MGSAFYGEGAGGERQWGGAAVGSWADEETPTPRSGGHSLAQHAATGGMPGTAAMKIYHMRDGPFSQTKCFSVNNVSQRSAATRSSLLGEAAKCCRKGFAHPPMRSTT